MTTLKKQIKRLVVSAAGEYVVTLTPATDQWPATISVRVKGKLSGYEITVGGLYVTLAVRAADQKKAARRKRGSLLGG